MDSLNALYALQAAGLQTTQATANQSATSRVDFDGLLASLQKSTGTAESYASSEAYAQSLQQELLQEIAGRVDGAPNYLYSFHPAVFEKMSADPQFMEQMLGAVDEWTNSAGFMQAKSSSDLLSSMLAGQNGEYALSNAQLDGLGGYNSILDLIVSDEAMTQRDTMSQFLSQFSGLPSEYSDLLVDSLASAQVAGGTGSAYYQSLAATAEVQKRLLDL